MQPGEAARVLEQCVSGEVAEANALPQLLHLFRSEPRTVLSALSEKANAVVANADSGSAAIQAGVLLVNVAGFLDERAVEGVPGASGAGVRRALLDHALLLVGGPGRAAKDTAVRAQGCALVAALAVAAPEHAGARGKLLEFALDRVPSIRERAVRGLGSMAPSSEAEQALVARTHDHFAAVRAAAVSGLRVSSSTLPALMQRIDDVEACVRAQLFRTLAAQPATVKDFGPACLARLCAGLVDRSSAVRAAAGHAADAWREQCGGALALLTACDVTSDEALGDAVAGALAARFPGEGKAAVREHLSGGGAAAQRRRSRGKEVAPVAKSGAEGLCAVLFARHAVASMSEEDRDETVDVPGLLHCTGAALDAVQGRPHGVFYLRQFLHAAIMVDFCDEALRRGAERLAEAVLSRAPLLASCAGGSPPGLADLGVVLLRRCSGLGRGGERPRGAKQQAAEAQCSTRVVLLVSDLCQPLQASGATDGEEDFAEGNFAVRLSLRLHELGAAIHERLQKKVSLGVQKKNAVANEEFIQAQRLKEAAKKNDAELAALQKEQAALKTERDCSLLRVLAILKALLRWSGSDLRRDPALGGILGQILRPVVSLPALSEEVEVAAVSAICLLCARDAATARSHWSLLLELLRTLRQEEGHGAAERRHLRARATVAARTLADCALVHHGEGGLDRDEVLSAALALAAVPFAARHIAIEPLCRWLLGLGHIFFEEHLHEPVLEVQWALGWMLVEAFAQHGQAEAAGDEEEAPRAPPGGRQPQRGKVSAAAAGAEGVDGEDGVEAIVIASRLTQFFNLLPKLPGKHAAPMLSLAVESVAESGLWRRAVLLPRVVDGKERWLRDFSWPQLFAFAHERLPADMRFRLWRCSLQLCVTAPALAPLAEVPFALASCVRDAPVGAAELVREALAKGADEVALAPLLSRLRAATGKATPVGAPALLLPCEEAQAAERERRAALEGLGVRVEAWAPAELATPEAVPPHHRLRAGRTAGAGEKGKGGKDAAVPRRRGRGGGAVENMVAFLALPAVPEATPTPELEDSPTQVKRRRTAKTKDPTHPRLPLRDVLR